MIANSEAKIHFDQAGQNFYQPMTDEIHVTPKEGFKTTNEEDEAQHGGAANQ